MPVSFKSSLRCAPIVLCAAGVLALTACGGSSSSGQAASGSSSGGPSAPKQNPSTLTIAVTSTPVSINPALNGVGDPLELYSELSYDPLIYQKSDGSYAPGLATKWGFVGTGNKTFDMTLRPNVKFSDGSALTAQGVKNYFTYYHKASSFGSRLSGVKITVTGPLSLRFQLSAPDPDFAYLMTQDLGTGDVISPLGLKNPKALGTTTAGAGQYTLDSAATVTNQTYTFVRNPTYWDPSAIHWKKIVIKVLPNETAELDAMSSGQVDYMFGSPQDATAATSAGFVVTKFPYLFGHIEIMDLHGQTVKALGNEQVRQALDYAMDRPALVKALLGSYGSPDQQLLLPGAEGYDPSLNSTYTYDPAKAKQLLAAAGYPKGFSFNEIAYNLHPGETDMAQAIASEWAKIGVNVKITVPANIPAYVTDMASKKYSAEIFEFGGQDMYLASSQLLGPGDPFYDPFHITDPTWSKLETQGAVASAAAAPAIWDQLNKYVTQQGSYLSFGSVDQVIISRPGLDGIKATTNALNPDPVYFFAAK
jgi:ABC-type transport system substrate-binding protein